jgi:hypothetical protein
MVGKVGIEVKTIIRTLSGKTLAVARISVIELAVERAVIYILSARSAGSARTNCGRARWPDNPALFTALFHREARQ